MSQPHVYIAPTFLPIPFDTLLQNSPLFTGMQTQVGIEAKSPGALMVSPPDPAGTTSISYVMMGLSGDFLSVVGGKLLLTINGQLQNTSNNGQTWAALCIGLGTPPANGAERTGTILGTPASFEATSGGQPFVPFSLTGLWPDLPPATHCWIDLALRSTGGIGTASGLTVTAVEIT